MMARNFRHGKVTRVFVDAYELTGYLRSAEQSGTVDKAETSAFQDGAKTYVPGMVDDSFAFEGMFDGQVGAIRDQLQGSLGGNDHILTLAPEDAVFGRWLTLADVIQTKFGVKGDDANIVAISADMQSSGRAWEGPSLHDYDDAETVSGTSDPYNVGQFPLAFGGVGHLHVIANTMNAGSTFTVQHSASEKQHVTLTLFSSSEHFKLTAGAAQGAGTTSFITRGTTFTPAGIKAAIEATTGWPVGAKVVISGLTDAGFDMTFYGTLGGANVDTFSIGTFDGDAGGSVSTTTVGGTWADLLVFTTVAAGLTAVERKEVAGTVGQNLRGKWDFTGAGSASFVLAFARKTL